MYTACLPMLDRRQGDVAKSRRPADAQCIGWEMSYPIARYSYASTTASGGEITWTHMGRGVLIFSPPKRMRVFVDDRLIQDRVCAVDETVAIVKSPSIGIKCISTTGLVARFQMRMQDDQICMLAQSELKRMNCTMKEASSTRTIPTSTPMSRPFTSMGIPWHDVSTASSFQFTDISRDTDMWATPGPADTLPPSQAAVHDSFMARSGGVSTVLDGHAPAAGLVENHVVTPDDGSNLRMVQDHFMLPPVNNRYDQLHIESLIVEYIADDSFINLV